jgi:hypothetical protein
VLSVGFPLKVDVVEIPRGVRLSDHAGETILNRIAARGIADVSAAL